MNNEQVPIVGSKYLEQMKIAPKIAMVEPGDLFNIFCNNKGKIIHKVLHYFKIYERYFARYRNQEVHILEIGVFKGGSLGMWKKYFGDKAKIYGLDINPEVKRFEEENIRIFIGDQADPDFLRTVKDQLPPLDIIIDDGGHTTNQQIVSFLELYDKVKSDGVYLVEDLCTNYWPNYIDSQETFIDFAKRHIDALNSWFLTGYEGLRRYEQNPYLRSGDIQVPEFALITHSISFYNSIIVFEKQLNQEPYSYMTGQL